MTCESKPSRYAGEYKHMVGHGIWEVWADYKGAPRKFAIAYGEEQAWFAYHVLKKEFGSNERLYRPCRPGEKLVKVRVRTVPSGRVVRLHIVKDP